MRFLRTKDHSGAGSTSPSAITPGRPANSISKASVALRYFPGYRVDTALRKLRRTIQEWPPLREALRTAGYEVHDIIESPAEGLLKQLGLMPHFSSRYPMYRVSAVS